MFGKIGLPELILILVIALIIFGPRKLPEIGKSIGRGIREFRQATTEISRNVSLDDDDEDEKNEYAGSGDKPKNEKAPLKAEEGSEAVKEEHAVQDEHKDNKDEPDEQENILSASDNENKH